MIIYNIMKGSHRVFMLAVHRENCISCHHGCPEKQCLLGACSILKESFHPSYSLFQPLTSKRSYRGLRTRTSRFGNSFVPTAVSLLNSDSRWTSYVQSLCFLFTCTYIFAPCIHVYLCIHTPVYVLSTLTPFPAHIAIFTHVLIPNCIPV